MKRSKFTEQQIAFALQQAESGTQVAEVCRKMGISEATFYRWKQLYGGLMPSEARAALMAASRLLGKLGVNINPQKTGSCTSGMASSSSGTRSSEAVGPCGCRRARSELGPNRERCTRTPGRNRSATSTIRFAG